MQGLVCTNGFFGCAFSVVSVIDIDTRQCFCSDLSHVLIEVLKAEHGDVSVQRSIRIPDVMRHWLQELSVRTPLEGDIVQEIFEALLGAQESISRNDSNQGMAHDREVRPQIARGLESLSRAMT